MPLHSGKLLLGLSVSLLLGATAQADTVTGNGDWQSWSTANLIQGVSPTPGTPYWNNLSGDGSHYNIGWCLAGAGNCRISNPPGDIRYFGPSGGSAPANVAFTSSNYAVTARLEAIITDSRPLDIFGWYSIASDGSIGSLHPLFSSSDSIGAVETFKPSGGYGFYLEQNQGAPGNPFDSKYFFFMDSAKNFVEGYPNPGDNLQHFAVFDAGTSNDKTPYYIGAVDTRACDFEGSSTCDPPADFDYNDFIVRLDTVDTPEPGTLGLLACTLIAAAAFLRRRQVSR